MLAIQNDLMKVSHSLLPKKKKRKLPPFYLRSAKADGLTAIMFRIYDSQFADGRFVYSTKERIDSKNWDTGEGKAKRGFEHINARLLEIQQQASVFISLNRKYLTKEALQLHLDAGRPIEVVVEKERTLLEEWKIYLEITKGNVSKRTYWSYESSYDTFEAFLKEKRMLKLLPTQFDNSCYLRYRAHLKEKYPSANTAAKKLKHLKMVINSGVKVGMDAETIRFTETAGIKISLTEADIQKILKLNLDERLSRIRDLLIVHAHTGVRVSDLFRLDKNIQGNYFVIQQQKTLKVNRIPILPIVRAILEKYNYRLPYMSDVKYNAGLKLIYKAFDSKSTIQVREGEGFVNKPTWKEFSSHDLVRTFVTQSAARGMSISAIAQIVGKTVQVLLKNYLVESQDAAEQEMLEKWGM